MTVSRPQGCPGNCGESQGLGTCRSSGKCSCTLGWSGRDCGTPTCCPLMVLIIGGFVIAFGSAAILAWRLTKCRRERERKAQLQPDLQQLNNHPNTVSKSTHRISIGTVRQSVPATSQISQGQPFNAWNTTTQVSFDTRKLQRSATIGVASHTSGGFSAGAASGRPRSLSQDQLRSTASVHRQSTRSASSTGSSNQTTVGATHSEPVPNRRSIGRTSSQAGPDRGRQRSASCSARFPEASNDPISPEVRAVQEKLREMMSHPMLERKKTFKELLVEHHPDRNSSDYAKEVFQEVNNSRSWFLQDKLREATRDG